MSARLMQVSGRGYGKSRFASRTENFKNKWVLSLRPLAQIDPEDAIRQTVVEGRYLMMFPRRDSRRG